MIHSYISRSFASLLLVLVCLSAAQAQQGNFSLYHQTPFLTNPAMIGTVEDARIFANYRNQAVSAGENFQTSMISGYVPVQLGHHRLGLGAAFINDRSSDIVQTNGGMLGLAYSIQVFKRSSLSMGFQGGYFQRSLGFNFTTDQQYVDGSFDPGADNGESLINRTTAFMSGSGGLHWQWKDVNGQLKAFAGASIFNFNQPNASFITDGQDQVPVSWKFTAGYRAFSQGRFSLMPSLRYVQEAQNSFWNAGTWLGYQMNRERQQQLAFGMWYNTNQAGVLSLEYQQDNLSIATSYDLPVSNELNTALQTGIFEISMSLRIRKAKQPETPVVVEESALVEEVVEEEVMEEEVEESPQAEPVKPASLEKLQGSPMELATGNLPQVNRKMQLAEKDQLSLEKNVRFEFQTAELDQPSKEFLDQIAGIMQQNDWLKVELIGHTCNVGTEERNQELSLQRAREVQSYLMQQGLTAERFIIKGSGETIPIASNATEEGRSANRRVEFKIIENK
jgi:type IX secretion system PorP/SprF family membrane protein